jgi:hypothetical protein
MMIANADFRTAMASLSINLPPSNFPHRVGEGGFPSAARGEQKGGNYFTNNIFLVCTNPPPSAGKDKYRKPVFSTL